MFFTFAGVGCVLQVSGQEGVGEGELYRGVDGVDVLDEHVEFLNSATPEHHDVIKEPFEQSDWENSFTTFSS